MLLGLLEKLNKNSAIIKFQITKICMEIFPQISRNDIYLHLISSRIESVSFPICTKNA